MPQHEESQEIREFRRQMREGRAPLIQAVAEAYKPYLLAMKGWERKNSELREQVGLLSSDFTTKGAQLRASARKATEGGAGLVDLYRALATQAMAVSNLIDRELPNLVELYKPVEKLHAAYVKALAAYDKFMESWQGKLPESDLSGRALELALDPIERSLR